MSKYKGSSEIGRSSVGVHRSVGSLGEGERSEANSSPRDPSVLLSLGSVKNDGAGSDCFKREISNLSWKLRRCFFHLKSVQVVVFIGNHNGNLLSSVGHRRTTDGSRNKTEETDCVTRRSRKLFIIQNCRHTSTRFTNVDCHCSDCRTMKLKIWRMKCRKPDTSNME